MKYSGKNNYTSEIFSDLLLKCFTSGLPGQSAHKMLASPQRIKELADIQLQKKALRSGVLLLFYLQNGAPYLVFIKRPVYNGVHSGQVSFPGGKWEETDETLYHTALREATEEIGIKPDKVKFIGKLTDLYIPPSNFIVSPFVGIYEGVPVFCHNNIEVSEILNIPMSFFFLDNDPFITTEIILTDKSVINAYGIIFEGNSIWGATAMILNEFLIMWKTIANN